jgi:hypothetical protein
LGAGLFGASVLALYVLPPTFGLVAMVGALGVTPFLAAAGGLFGSGMELPGIAIAASAGATAGVGVMLAGTLVGALMMLGGGPGQPVIALSLTAPVAGALAGGVIGAAGHVVVAALSGGAERE